MVLNIPLTTAELRAVLDHIKAMDDAAAAAAGAG